MIQHKNMPEEFRVDDDDYLLDIEGSKFAFYHHYDFRHKTRANVTMHCIIYVIRGEKIMHSKDGIVSLKKGDVAFLKKGLYLGSEKQLDDGSFESITFFLQPKLIEDFIERNREHLMHVNQALDIPYMFKIEKSGRIKSYFESLIPYFQDRNKQEALMKLKFEELMLNLLTHEEFKIFRSFLTEVNNDRTVSFEAFVHEHYTENLSVSEMAFLSGMSLSNFKRKFQEIYQETPGKWLKTKRLEKAKLLLEQTDQNVHEICTACGFTSSSHFIEQFRLKYGNSPLKHRKIVTGA